MKSREELMRRFREAEEKFDLVYTAHGASDLSRSQWPKEFHMGVDLWLAGAEGVLRSLEWSLGRIIFYEAFYLFTFEFLKKMRLNYWQDDWAYLPWDSPIPLEYEQVPPFAVRDVKDVRMLLDRVVAVQNRVMFIDKVHPGSWSLMFQSRAKKWLVHAENTIRVLDWVAGNRDDSTAFYLLNERSMGQLDLARRGGVMPASANSLAYAKHLLGQDLGTMDHNPEDFR